jgi:hypothetical protein
MFMAMCSGTPERIANDALDNISIPTDTIGRSAIPGAGTHFIDNENESATDKARTHNGEITGGSDSVTNKPARHEHTAASDWGTHAEDFRGKK